MSEFTPEALFAHKSPSVAQRVEHTMSELRWAISKGYMEHTAKPFVDFPYETTVDGDDVIGIAVEMMTTLEVPRPKGEPVNPITLMAIDEGARLWCLLCALVQPVPVEPGEEFEDANRFADHMIRGRLVNAAVALADELTKGGMAGA